MGRMTGLTDCLLGAIRREDHSVDTRAVLVKEISLPRVVHRALPLSPVQPDHQERYQHFLRCEAAVVPAQR